VTPVALGAPWYEVSSKPKLCKSTWKLGDTCHAAGDHDAARQTWQRAQNILDELDHPDAKQVDAKPRTLGRLP
jgi:hypothetical protein